MYFKKTLTGVISMILLSSSMAVSSETFLQRLFAPPPDPIGVIQSVEIKTEKIDRPEYTVTHSGTGTGFVIGLLTGSPFTGALVGSTQQRQEVIPAYSATITSCDIKVSVNNGKIYQSYNYKNSLGHDYWHSPENVEKCTKIKQGERFDFVWAHPGHPTHFEYSGLWFREVE